MSSNNSNNGWWTFHGDERHSGNVPGSTIDSSNAANLKTLYTLQLGGPIMSVPAVSNDHVYVGIANAVKKDGGSVPDGGFFHKISLATGTITHTFYWPTDRSEGDTHGFCGMGCTPAVSGGFVYFSAFDGKLYCLNESDLSRKWVINLRNPDPNHNQPINNDNGQAPKAEGWSSPLVVNNRVYVGLGEGENPSLYAFIYCLDATSGDVIWIYCTNQFVKCQPNQPNQLPAQVLDGRTPDGYTVYHGFTVTRGCSVWTAIAYDADLNRLYATTGNPAPVDNGLEGGSPGWSYGILSLDADSGAFKGFYQANPKSSYRVSDIDVDFGGSPVVFEREGRKVVAAGCKNGGFFIVDADTMAPLNWRQMLPFYNNGDQIPTVDPHGPDTGTNPNPALSNQESNVTPAENFYGTYSTPAIYPDGKRIFIGIGGNNYHFIASGIDHTTTPFMRVMDWNTLKDVWELDDSDPRKYKVPSPPMYETAGEAALSSPAVVNDVVFCSTSKVALYAFNAADGSLLWSDVLGMQSGGFQGGYGYCIGPAVAGDYVVAGGLVFGRDGGILRIYGVKKGGQS